MISMAYTICYGVLVALSLTMAHRARGREPLLFGAALILASTYAISNFCWWFVRPDPYIAYAAMDGICAALFAIQWLKSGRPWLEIMTTLFVCSGLVHAWFGDQHTWHSHQYDVAINWVFILKNTVVITDAATILVLARLGVRMPRSNKAST